MSKPLGPRKNLMLRLPEELHGQLTLLATTRGLKLNELLVQLLADGWQAAPERPEIAKLQRRLAKMKEGGAPDDARAAA